MYLTAHRVWSRSLDQQAVHAFYYRHRNPLETPIDISKIADQDPGELVASRVELPPGGNEIRSYLDVAASQDLGSDELEQALDRLSAMAEASTEPSASSYHDGIAARFYANPRFISSRSLEIQALSRAILQLHREEGQKQPLTVRMKQVGRSVQFSLDPDSEQRIRGSLDPSWVIPPAVSVDPDTLGDFEEIHGPIYQELLAVLTGLDATQIEAIGGYRVVTQAGDQIAAGLQRRGSR